MLPAHGARSLDKKLTKILQVCEQIPGARVFGMIALKPLMAHMEPNKGAKRIFYSLWKLRFFLGFMLKGSFFLQCNFCSTEACCFNFHNTCVYVKLLRVVHKYNYLHVNMHVHFRSIRTKGVMFVVDQSAPPRPKDLDGDEQHRTTSVWAPGLGNQRS